jgi:hypothetical protein
MHGLKRRGLETEHQPPRQSPTLLSRYRAPTTAIVRESSARSAPSILAYRTWSASSRRLTRGIIVTGVTGLLLTAAIQASRATKQSGRAVNCQAIDLSRR